MNNFKVLVDNTEMQLNGEYLPIKSAHNVPNMQIVDSKTLFVIHQLFSIFWNLTKLEIASFQFN